jgi:circadian clock protein KaiC
MGTDQSSDPILERVSSGIRGLDSIVRGGFIRGGIFIIQGPPGADKTILGHQICFGHIGTGSRALFVTMLAENHARMLLHISQLDFFDATAIPTASIISAPSGPWKRMGWPAYWICCAARFMRTMAAC